MAKYLLVLACFLTSLSFLSTMKPEDYTTRRGPVYSPENHEWYEKIRHFCAIGPRRAPRPPPKRKPYDVTGLGQVGEQLGIKIRSAQLPGGLPGGLPGTPGGLSGSPGGLSISPGGMPGGLPGMPGGFPDLTGVNPVELLGQLAPGKLTLRPGTFFPEGTDFIWPRPCLKRYFAYYRKIMHKGTKWEDCQNNCTFGDWVVFKDAKAQYDDLRDPLHIMHK